MLQSSAQNQHRDRAQECGSKSGSGGGSKLVVAASVWPSLPGNGAQTEARGAYYLEACAPQSFGWPPGSHQVLSDTCQLQANEWLLTLSLTSLIP